MHTARELGAHHQTEIQQYKEVFIRREGASQLFLITIIHFLVTYP